MLPVIALPRPSGLGIVVKGRKGRFPAHFLSFPLILVGHWAGGGGELEADGRVLAAVLVVFAGRWAGLGERGLRYSEVGIGTALAGLGGGLDLRRWVIWYGRGGVRARGKCHQGAGVSEPGFFGGSWEDYGGRRYGFLPQKPRNSQKIGAFLAQTGMSVLPELSGGGRSQ